MPLTFWGHHDFMFFLEHWWMWTFETKVKSSGPGTACVLRRNARTNNRQRWGNRSRKRGRCNDTHRLATGLASEGDVIASCTHHVAAVRWLGAVRAVRRKGGQAANETTVLAICYLDNRHRRRRSLSLSRICRTRVHPFSPPNDAHVRRQVVRNVAAARLSH